MQSMDDALDELLKADVIDGVDAYFKAAEKHRFEKYAPQ